MNKRLMSTLLSLLCFTTASALQFEVSDEIAIKLQEKQAVVIFGAPSSGKTELMEIALDGRPAEVFDLRREFLQYYSSTHNIVTREEQKALKQQFSFDPALKKAELAWLKKEQQNITEKFLNSTASILIFDEFDLTVSPELNSDEIRSVLTILSMVPSLCPP